MDEFEEDIEDDEFVLCTLFRCGMNIRETSSALIELRPPVPPLLLFQPSLDNGWKLGGEATAVVIEIKFRQVCKIQRIYSNAGGVSFTGIPRATKWGR